MSVQETLLTYLTPKPAAWLAKLEQQGRLQEIRLRADKPLLLRLDGREYALSDQGQLLDGPTPQAYRPSVADMAETVERISRHSLYAFEEALRMGYITLPGGHRVGVAGQTVTEGKAVRAVRHISGLNLRLAHCVTGCADDILPRLFNGAGAFCHTLIVSPPGCGKTTLLRDMVRQLSDGTTNRPGLTVGLVDERSEIAGCYRGIPQNDVGQRTDVLDGCPKAEGMVMLLRAMAPDIIAVDELGGQADSRAVADVLNAGVKLLCTAHGDDVGDLRRSPTLSGLTEIFQRFVVLRAPGQGVVLGKEDGHGY